MGELKRMFLLAGILTFFAFASVSLRELTQAKNFLNTDILRAAVQNIDELSEFPFVISIGTYLILLYIVRFLMLYPVAVLMLLLGKRMKTMRASMAAGLGIFVLPALFAVLGGEVFKWISPIVPVSSAELFLKIGEGKWASVLPFVVWGTAGIFGILSERGKLRFFGNFG